MSKPHQSSDHSRLCSHPQRGQHASISFAPPGADALGEQKLAGHWRAMENPLAGTHRCRLFGLSCFHPPSDDTVYTSLIYLKRFKLRVLEPSK
jgi:hypothetical protein